MLRLWNPFANLSWCIEEDGPQVEEDGDVIKSQPDLLPVPSLPHGPRKWGAFHLTGYWIAEAFGISQHQVAASSVAGGLSPGATIGAIFLGHVIISVACAHNGWVDAVYGINFPVYARASFDVHGTAIRVICRAVAAIFWFGTQTYQGGQCVSVMVGAIWPSFKDLKNHLLASAKVTSSELLSFFIFYIIQLPILWIHISKLRYLFLVKVIIMPISGFTLFGWAVGRAHGFGPNFSQETDTTTSTAAFLFFSAMTSAICSLSVPVTLCAILGVVVTSAVQVIYGVTSWNPLQVCELWDSTGAAKFFAAFCWALAVIATNISSNLTAVGNDLAILFPKFINIRRGQHICAVLELYQVVTSFLGGYSILLGPIAGVMLSGRQENAVHVCGQYWYTADFNWRAILAFTFSLIPNLPGFALNVNRGLQIPIGASYVFCCIWPVGFVVGASLYLAFTTLFLPDVAPILNLPKGSHSTESGSIDDREKNLKDNSMMRVEAV